MAQSGRKPESFPGRLQTSPEIALVHVPFRGHLLGEEPKECQKAPEELVAAAVSRLDSLLSFLTKAARNSLELPTSQVQLLVGDKPRGTSFSRYEFTLRPAGKYGQETSWRVKR